MNPSLSNRSEQRDRQELARALDAHQRGDLARAVAGYQTLLARSPNNPDALHYFGVACFQKGEHAKALELIRTAIRHQPNNPQCQNNLGEVLRAQRDMQAAIVCFQKAITLSPDYSEAHHNLGLCWAMKGELERAATAFLAATESNPEAFDSWLNLGEAMVRLGRYDEALRAWSKVPDTHPAYPEVLLKTVELNLISGHVEAALKLSEELRADDGDVRGAVLRGKSLLAAQRYHEAVTVFDSALRIQNLALLHELAASALIGLGELTLARAAIQNGLQIDAESPSLLCQMGDTYLIEGATDKAQSYFRQSVLSDPTYGPAWKNLAEAAKFRPMDSAMLSQLEKAVAAGDLNESQRRPLCFAFAKVLETQGRHDEAFDYYLQGNKLRRKQFKYDSSAHRDRVANIMDVFNEGRMERALAGCSDDPRPVFIVGMGRSGTTLLEQMLCGHPNIESAGELGYFTQLKLKDEHGTARSYLERMDDLTAGAVQGMTRDYLASLEQHTNSGTSRVIDKMPTNYLHLGLIAAAFPQAAILHCRRDPRDVCVSTFFADFTYGNRHTCDLMELGRYYFDYARLMQHWHRVLPGRILDISYEDVVQDSRGELGIVLKQLGLPWDEACLEFHQAGRQVRTASQWQVRQPIYQDSIGRWRRFEDHLEPLMKGLAGE